MNNKIDDFFGNMMKLLKETPKDKEGLDSLQEHLKTKLKDIEKNIEKNKDMNDVYKENKEE